MAGAGTVGSSGTKPGSVTMAFLNVDANRSFAINLNGENTDGTPFKTDTREEYILSSAGMGPPGPHQSMLSSLHILLNGKLLELGESNTLPPLVGKSVVSPKGSSNQ